MRYLFIHQNFPGQYKHLAPALANIPGNQVVALVDEQNRKPAGQPSSVTVIAYKYKPVANEATHHYVRGFESNIRRGQHVVRACLDLKKKGFVPDVIVVHAGWGEALFLKQIYSDARIVSYFEFYYQAVGADIGFDMEFGSPTIDDLCRLSIKNATHHLSLDRCDLGMTPTHWQARQFPEYFHSKLNVVHEGVDTNVVKPCSEAVFDLNGRSFTRADSVITFVNRNLEPYRGFHVFMRTIPKIQAECPNTHIIIVGGDDVSYGRKPSGGGNWREKMLLEMAGRIDLSRVHFVGKIPYEKYLSLLQISSAHIYLTYPFVLSWSMLEAMAAGCTLIGSNTPPVSEVIRHNENGLLVDFFDKDSIAETVADVIHHPETYKNMRASARSTIVDRYDLERVCLPKQIKLLQQI